MNKIYTVVGARGQGKTPFIVGGDEECGLAKIYLNKGMSVLTLDEIDHVKYRHVPIMHPKDYSKLSEKPVFVRTLAAMQYLPGLIGEIGEKQLVWNTLIVCEDSKKYIKTVFGNEEWALIGNSKQQNCDLVFMYWNWGIIPPDILRNTNYFVIFKTSDGPECRKSYLHGCFDKCQAAHDYVTAGKKRYVMIDTGI